MERLKREITKVAAIGIAVCTGVGLVVGIAIDTLIHQMRDEGRSDHFKKDNTS